MKVLHPVGLLAGLAALVTGVSRGAVITYSIAIDDTTNGVGGIGHWGIYASTSGSPGGLLAYNYTINANPAIIMTNNLAPETVYTDSGGKNENLNAGFTFLRTANTVKAVTGAQNIFTTPYYVINDFGIAADTIPALPPLSINGNPTYADPNNLNGLGWDGTTSIVQASYGAVVPTGIPLGAVLLGRGTYTGAVGSLGTAVTTWFDTSTPDKNSGNVLSGTSGYANTIASSVVLNVVEEAPIPEPASIGLLAAGASLLTLRRRRRMAVCFDPAKKVPRSR